VLRTLPGVGQFTALMMRALQLDSSRTAADRAAARKIQQNSQPDDSTLVTGPGTYALLTPMALMGAADRVERRRHGGTGALGMWPVGSRELCRPRTEAEGSSSRRATPVFAHPRKWPPICRQTRPIGAVGRATPE
jgi:hypothetical protein